jgi:hypothetical protein
MKRALSLLPAIVAIVFPFVTVQACGPFFEPDIFVHKIHPDHPAEYATGKLGILLPTYPRVDLIVAWRYLNGASLGRDEQEAYQPTLSFGEYERDNETEPEPKAPDGSYLAEPIGPADEWLRVRNRHAPVQPDIHAVKNYDVTYPAGYVLAGSYENCQADAFHTAVLTLDSRTKTWGAKSPELANWITGQDAVFSNCGGSSGDYPPGKTKITPTQPMPAPANAPVLLRQDRAYQLAAAQFYSGQFAPARESFQSIANDPDSPWRGVAAYLVARTLIREAFLSAKPGEYGDMASFDPELMRQAQQQLEFVRNHQVPDISPHAVQSLLNLVRIRTEPQARLRELSAVLSGPKPDPDYKQDLNDLTWYLNARADSLPVREDAWDEVFHVKRGPNDYRPLTSEEKKPGFEQAMKDLSDVRSISPLIDWLITFQSPADGARRHAIAEWKRTSNSAWLTVAIMKASPSDPETSALLDGSAHIPSTSPAWPTIAFYRIRLLNESGKAAEARTELASAFPSIQAIGSDSDLNLFTGLRMRTASTLDEALADAPRRVLDRTSIEQASLDECLDVMRDPKRKYDCRHDSGSVEFSADAADLLNRETPLATFAQAAQSTALPPRLRQAVAVTAWVRAVLLKNEAIATRMLPLLPEKIQQQAGSGIGWHPVITLLRNPGLRPYLDAGVQRSYSYDFVESYADNWWCAEWSTPYSDSSEPVHFVSAAFLTPAERSTAENEFSSLTGIGSADVALGSQAVDYVKAHPQDPDAPEALYLVLRMIRYGCNHAFGYNQDPSNPHAGDISRIAYEVGDLMRHRYATNPWTKKAAPYVWPTDKKAGQ